jgi:adenine-specific DNA methylase
MAEMRYNFRTNDFWAPDAVLNKSWMATSSSMLNKEEKWINLSSCKLQQLFIVEKHLYLD